MSPSFPETKSRRIDNFQPDSPDKKIRPSTAGEAARKEIAEYHRNAERLHKLMEEVER